MNTAIVREYTSQDRNAALQCFQSNIPSFFHEFELAWFTSCLDEPDGPCFVVVRGGEIVGFGGYEVSEFYNSAVLVFGHIHADWHGKGLGVLLLEFRISHLRANAQPTRYLVVDTIPKVAPFYVKQGFEIAAHWPQGYRNGTDRVDLRFILS